MRLLALVGIIDAIIQCDRYNIIMFCLQWMVVLTFFLSSSWASPYRGEEKLKKIIQEAHASHTDALLILKNDQVLVDINSDGPPIDSMSVTKSIVSLAIGMLIDEGKIVSIDDPIWKYYPQWKQGCKQEITLRHLLNHTSGLKAQNIEEICSTLDVVQFALASALSDRPGKAFLYNNNAVNLLSGIIEKVSGVRLDEYLKKRLFEPLSIKKFSWTLDKAGHAYAMSGLQIQAKDLAKIGQLILQQGKWNGKQIVSQEWLELSMEDSQPFKPGCGLLWWRIKAPIDVYMAQGYLGQYLIIIPETRMVGVRQIRTDKKNLDPFEKFPHLLIELSQSYSQ